MQEQEGPMKKGHLWFAFMAVIFLCVVGAGEVPAYILIDSFTSYDAAAVATGYHPANAHYGGQPVGWRVTANGWRIEPDYVAGPPPWQSTLVTVTETGLSGVLGGSRFTSAQWDPYYGDASSVLSASAGRMSFNNGPGERGWISMRYGGMTGSQRDFSKESAIRVAFDPDHLSFGRPSIMRLKLTDGDSFWTVEKTWPYISPAPEQTADFLLSAFSDNGINVADIRSIEMWYQGDDSNDVGFTEISTVVPIPAALWLLGSGLVGLVGLRKKYSC
jgi:hypothetical protein